MKKTLLTFLVLVSSISFAESIEDSYFKNTSNPKLNRQESVGLRYARDFSSDGRMAAPPGLAEQGRIMFELNTNPSVVCAVFQVCDIALEAGEEVNNINAGDTSRWDIQFAVSGKNGLSQYHVLVKPFDVGLNTSLFIATNKRTYHIRLKSHRTQFMPSVGFIYPEDQQASLRKAQEEARQYKAANELPSGQNINNLNFNYKISGDNPSWKPIRVYNDGIRTFIQMPTNMAQTEAPTILIVRDGENTLINYRLEQDRFMVDTIFDKAILITGAGRHQSKVVIKKQ